MTGRPAPWLTAAEASRLLGVNRATLYAYVSRGHVRSQPSPAARQRMYAQDDVERLRRRTEERRSPDKAAARALQWGMPILESSIALIDGTRLYYRGIDAETLARSRSLEEVAGLIWSGQLDVDTLWRGEAQGFNRALRRARRMPNGPFIMRAQAMLAGAAAADSLAFDLRPSQVALTGRRILRLLTNAATMTDPGNRPVAEALANQWASPRRARDLVSAALVLCADHELNVSSFTARCVASAGSHPYAVVIAGLAALEGPKHGGASARAESMLDLLRRTPRLGPAIAARLRRGESIDGFGHPLYPRGDPRASVLLDMLRERYEHSPEYRFISAFADAATNATGERPNIDFALAGVARVLKLSRGAPLMLFAIGRSVGWIGHAIEQYATAQLIRPRAKYVGVPPVARAAPDGRNTV